MKLAFCLFNYFPYGGLQRDFMKIADACLKRQHDIHVFTMAWEGEKPPFHLHLIDVSAKQNHTRATIFAKKLKAHFAKSHYDVVIGFNKMPGLDIYYAADVCYKARVQNKHGYLYRLLPRYRTYVELEKAVFEAKSQTEILLISALQQNEYTKHYQTQMHRFHLLPPGIAKDRIAPENADEIRNTIRRTFHIPDDHFLLLLIGSGFKTKGLDRAILGLASLPESLKNRTHLFVIGEDQKAPFQKLAKAHHVLEKVIFLGGRHDVPQLLLAGDLLVHPAYHENTGTVLLEALVSKLPVLTTDVCGYAHYINEANAGVVLASPFNQQSFNETLKDMLLSDKMSLWRQNGFAFAAREDIYQLPEKAADFIEQVGYQRDSLST